MRETDWTPSEDEIEWTRTNLEPLEVGGVWAPHGLEYERIGDTTLRLISIENHEGTREAHARVCKVLDALEWTVDDDSVERITNQPSNESLADQQRAEMQRIQSIVSGWTCPNEECGTHLTEFNLELCEWTNHGDHEFLNPDTGETGSAERWLAHIQCPNCDTEVPMNPLDYGYLAGEDMFYTWRISDTECLRVLTREGTVELIDSGKIGIALGSRIRDMDIPPHMQGTYCVLQKLDEEE